MATVSDHAKLGWIILLTLLGLILYSLAFGDGLTPRPIEYTPIDYMSAACVGLKTDTTVFRFGLGDDIRWAEIYVEDSPGHQRLVAVAAFAPGADGGMTLAEVLLPSGSVVRFQNVEALRASPYAEVCQVAALWLSRI